MSLSGRPPHPRFSSEWDRKNEPEPNPPLELVEWSESGRPMYVLQDPYVNEYIGPFDEIDLASLQSVSIPMEDCR